MQLEKTPCNYRKPRFDWSSVGTSPLQAIYVILTAIYGLKRDYAFFKKTNEIKGNCLSNLVIIYFGE